jgi:hypothetical protein
VKVLLRKSRIFESNNADGIVERARIVAAFFFIPNQFLFLILRDTLAFAHVPKQNFGPIA